MKVKNIKYKVFDFLEQKLVLTEKITNLTKEREDLCGKIRAICHHPESHVVEKKYYFGGSYYDTAYTDYWRECTICGEKSQTTTKNHGYYG